MDHIPDRDLIDEIDRRLHQRSGQADRDRPDLDADDPTGDTDDAVPEPGVPPEPE